MPELDLTEETPFPFQEQRKPKNYNVFNTRDFLFLGVITLLLGLFFFKGCPGPNPDPTPDIDVPGVHVMILEEVSKHKDLSVTQQGIFTSPELIQWGEKNCTQYDGWPAFLKADVKDDLKHLPKIMEEMKSETLKQMSAKSLSPPILSILTPKGFSVEPLPEDKDRTLQLLEAVK